MRTKLYFVITLFAFFALAALPNSFAQGTLAQPSVRLVYFLPSDRPVRPDRIEALRELIKDTQAFYADEMERHGYGRKTFRVETDADGDPIVHRFNGRFNENYYYQPLTDFKVWEEVFEHFDDFQHVYFIAIDLSSELLNGGNSCGLGGLMFFPSNIETPAFSFGSVAVRHRDVTEGEEVVGGSAIIPASGHCFFDDVYDANHPLRVTTHELAHAFGLDHDFSDPDSAVGGRGVRFSECDTEWLSVSRFFNSTPVSENASGDIQLISPPTYSAQGVTLRFEVTDTDGLHQAQLLVPEDGSWGPWKLIGCHGLDGETQRVEFLSSELNSAPERVMLQFMDALGNITWATFLVDIASVLPPPKFVSIPDTNLAQAVREALNLNPNARITDQKMWGLKELHATEKQIKNLTGLEHATNLTLLSLSNNNISDISALASLTNLTRLYLRHNSIHDISAVANLTNLTELDLNNNNILDISAVANLTNLTRLLLYGSSIHDISAVANLTNLTVLVFAGNTISDISAIANLTNLTDLYLHGNTISNIVPLIALTRLKLLVVSENPISDRETLARLMAQGTVVYFTNTPAFETPGEKITDEWVWLVVPTLDVDDGVDAARSGRDFLSEASGGTLTEADVAVNGATAGTRVGDRAWTSGSLAPTGSNNLGELVDTYGLGTDIGDHPVAYGVVSIESATYQDTRLYIGALPVKVWLNGAFVHLNTYGDWWSVSDYRTAVPVTLNPGANLLFIAAYRQYPWENWGAFFGFQDGTDYTVGAPGAGNLDINRDGQVNIIDLVWVAISYGMRGDGLPADVNADGIVNVADFAAVAAGVDAVNPLPQGMEQVLLAALEQAIEIEGVAVAPMGFGDSRRDLVYGNVAAALVDARLLAKTGDARLRKGVALLETLLELLREMRAIPETTALLPNYPNPFNPETWLPYHLAKDADVTLRIYAANGQLIRRLAIGHQPAGIYQSKSRAAYWDGKNETGETVASGVYFYTLTTSEFTATRKMLIRK